GLLHPDGRVRGPDPRRDRRVQPLPRTRRTPGQLGMVRHRPKLSRGEATGSGRTDVYSGGAGNDVGSWEDRGQEGVLAPAIRLEPVGANPKRTSLANTSEGRLHR